MIKKVLFISLFIARVFAFGQDSSLYHQVENHLKQAKSFNNLSKYAESINELNQAIEISKELNWEKKFVELIIYRSEIKRKTNDYKEGLSDLLELKESIKYPHLHVKKLGRIAAFYSEGSIIFSIENNNDSILLYIDSALKVADKIGLVNEKAGLYNELGFMLGSTNTDSSIYYLRIAVNMFVELGDIPNYVVAQTNLMRVYTYAKEYEKVKGIIKAVLHEINQESWNSLEVEHEFYRTLTYYYFIIEDEASFNTWNIEKYRLASEVTTLTSTRKLNSYRALYETKKYQDQAAIKVKELEKETKRRKELAFFLVVLLILIVGVIFLLIRENKLKQKVDKANEKYHMLIVESNHRIKNNLQMISSIIEYSTKGIMAKKSRAVDKISGKINTISALHKHLYLDVHNEKVDLKTYFEDIVLLYKDISNGAFNVVFRIDTVKIPSERLVYFGLIFNEMLSNTIEHSNAIKKDIFITISGANNQFLYSYQDNSSFDSNSIKGTGSDLIEQLVKRIDGSEFSIDGEVGKYQFKFYA